MNAIIFYVLIDEEIEDFNIIIKSLKDIKKHNFDAIYLEYRGITLNINDPKVIRAVSFLIKEAKKLQIKVILGVGLNLIHNIIRNELPEAFLYTVTPYSVKLKKGEFSFETKFSGSTIMLPGSTGEVLGYSIEKSWIIHKINNRLVRTLDVTDRFKYKIDVEGGGCLMTREDEPIFMKFTGRIKDCTDDGELFVLIKGNRFISGIDLTNIKLHKIYKNFLNIYSGYKLDGIACDEPGFSYCFAFGNARPISDNIYYIFKKRFGYSLKDNLLSLYFDIVGKKSYLVRYHYYLLLSDGLSNMERYLKKESKKVFGKDILIGIHRTMHEENSDDLYWGSIDYFKHNKGTSDGFTDSVFHREDSML